MWSSRSKVAPSSVTSADQFWDGEVPSLTLGREAAAFEVGEGSVVGGDHAGAGTGFDAHVADGHASFHGEGTDGGAGIFHGISGRASSPDAADDVEDDVLGGDAGREVSFDVDAEGFGLVLWEGLSGHDVLDFAGADAEGESSEGTVGGGVGVAANDGHAGLGGAEFGADHVDDALRGVFGVEELDAEVGAVFAQGVDLSVGDLVGDDEAVVDAGSGDVVVDRGDVAVGAAELAAGEAQAFEGLRAGDLVDELEVDVKDCGLAGGFGDHVLLPDFFEEGAGGDALGLEAHGCSLLGADEEIVGAWQKAGVSPASSLPIMSVVPAGPTRTTLEMG